MLIKTCKDCHLSKMHPYPPYQRFCGHPDGSQEIGEDLHELCPLKESPLVTQLDKGPLENILTLAKCLMEEIEHFEGKPKGTFKIEWEDNQYKVKRKSSET